MQAFFSSNNPIISAFGKIVDVVYVSGIWLLFSIPLVTIGASTTALYYTVNKVVRNQRGYMFREFWGSFKSNFRQSTILWLSFIALLFFLRADLKALDYLGYGDNKVFLYIAQGAGIFALLVLVYALCYVARFTQKLGLILLNSLLMLLTNLPRTLLLLLVCILAALMIYTTPLLLIITPGVSGLLANIVLEKVFVKYMSDEDREMEAWLNHPHDND